MLNDLINGPYWNPLVFFLLILVTLSLGRLAKMLMDRSAQRFIGKKQEWIGILLKSLSKPTVTLFLLGAFWISYEINLLSLQSFKGMELIIEKVLCVLNAVVVGYVIYSLVDVVNYFLISAAERTTTKVDDILAPLVGKSIRITVVVLVVLNILSVIMKEDIATIIASLGIGGLAIALAGQDTMKNFFGSLVILGDKPFEIGERIVVDNQDGVVENVGFRSTKIRRLDGHLVSIPNSEMVNNTVQNVAKRPFIKRTANIAVTYDTSPEKLEKGISIIKDVLKDHEGLNPDCPPRVYFNEFNDWSLNIVMIYWYHPAEYWEYMEFTDRVNKHILKRFNEEGIEFAFPSQTLYMANTNIGMDDE